MSKYIVYNNINKESDFLNNKYEMIKNISLVTQIGLTFVVTLLFSMFLGNIIDNVLNTEFVFKIIFLLVGIAAGFLNVYKIIMKSIKK